MNERTPPAFSVGDDVQRINQPENYGKVKEARWNSQTESWNYVVQFGAQKRTLPEESLRPLIEILDNWEALRIGQLSGSDHFKFLLTYHRLQNPPTRIAHSFATTRTLFFPHQFKPLLKFLDNPEKRLLIADDVGLGKTIEAGYILRELQAQEAVERILILVPARLAPKWEREMQSRFQETFKVVKGNDIVNYAERFQAGKDVEPFRWIASYESVRTEAVRDAIDSVQLPIDVLIADEAHRMRNSETLQHKVGDVLCRCSESVIFLSATPVQNKLEDLWNLVRLLSDKENGEFALWPVFQQQMEANKWLIEAQRELQKSAPDWTVVLRCLNQFEYLWTSEEIQTSERDRHVRSLRELIRSAPDDRGEIIELQSEIGRLSPIGHIISRTRKSEAMPERAERDASWKRVILSETERAIYSGVEELCRRAWPGTSDSWGFRMSLMMAYRITASCIPAAIGYFAEKLNGVATQNLSEVMEEYVEDSKEREDMTIWDGPTRDLLLEYIELHGQADETDSKFDEFCNSLRIIWREDDEHDRTHRKVVVFSYFRRTLEYLSKKLRGLGITNQMIHGGISIDDREKAIDTFLSSQDTNILLTSEVGGEGVDLQRASIVINYDLPWNPMVVEQRVGRVDRIGQKEKRIIILNLVVKDSIEERVLERLLKKIDIFKDSIGELDEIIGNEIEEITQQALTGELSDEELSRRIEETGKLISRRIREAKHVLSRTDDLLAADQALVDEINALIGKRQIPAEPELFHFLNTALAKRFHGCQFPELSLKRVIDVDLRQIAPSIETFARNGNPEASKFARRIAAQSISITLSREAAYSHPAAELIHFDHPLTQFSLREMQNEQFPAAFSILLSQSDTQLVPGEYAFLLADIKIIGDRPKSKMAAIIVNLQTGESLLDQETTIGAVVQMLECGKDIDPNLLGANFEPVKKQLISGLDGYIKDWREKEERIEIIRYERQIASRKKAFEYRLKQEQDRLDRLISQGAREFPIRMQKAKYENARKRLDSLLASRPPEQMEIESAELAVGLLQIQ